MGYREQNLSVHEYYVIYCCMHAAAIIYPALNNTKHPKMDCTSKKWCVPVRGMLVVVYGRH